MSKVDDEKIERQLQSSTGFIGQDVELLRILWVHSLERRGFVVC